METVDADAPAPLIDARSLAEWVLGQDQTSYFSPESAPTCRLVEVPDGAHAVFISDRFIEIYKDWTRVGGPVMYGDDYKVIEAKIPEPDENELTIDLQTRFATVPAQRVYKRLNDGAYVETAAQPEIERR